MASPTIESLCCLTSSNKFSQGFLIDFHTIPYNVVSIISALFGIGGALFQIFRKENSNHRIQRRPNRFLHTRGRTIIRWLAVADLLAAIGILIRSISWVSDKTFGASETDTILGQSFCIVTSAWIHYFYTATYFWTFIYALDVKLVLEDKRINPKIYHFIGWTLPAVLCVTGLLFLYLPDLNCYSFMVNPYQRFLPNYLSTFVPIVFVMTVNPILFIISFSSIEKLLASTTGRFTQRERQIVQSLKIKFLLITLVFFICWFPNIVNGVILWTAWQNLPKIAITIVWYLMTLLNPLQAVLNCFVYRRWDSDIMSGRPFWVHPMLWLEENVSFTGSSSSDRDANIVDSSSPDETINVKGFNPFKDQSPWQRLPFFKRAPSGKRTSEHTPLLTSVPKTSFLVSGEGPESGEEDLASS